MVVLCTIRRGIQAFLGPQFQLTVLLSRTHFTIRFSMRTFIKRYVHTYFLLVLTLHACSLSNNTRSSIPVGCLVPTSCGFQWIWYYPTPRHGLSHLRIPYRPRYLLPVYPKAPIYNPTYTPPGNINFPHLTALQANDNMLRE